MQTALYVIWFLIPLFFFVMALWCWLEEMGGKTKKENPGDFLKQGLFVLACVLISIVIDRYALEAVVTSVLNDWVPLGFVQIMLLPIVLYVGALLLGPSKEILIGKAPHPTKRPQSGSSGRS